MDGLGLKVLGARGFGLNAVWGSGPVVQMFLRLWVLDLKVFWGVKMFGFQAKGVMTLSLGCETCLLHVS